MKKISPSLIGFLQALGLMAYCFLTAGLFWVLKEFFQAPPAFLGTMFMLFFFIFSAAVTGFIFFGYSAYLVFNNKIKEALVIIAYTLLHCSGILGIAAVILFAFTR